MFRTLFESSVVADYAGVTRALAGEPLLLSKFLELARKADIPYPLFFAPINVVEAQLSIKVRKLMAGFTKPYFSMHSRSSVELRDVELIVKDLLRKQELIRKNDPTLQKNPLVGMLARSSDSVVHDAKRLMSAVGISRDEIRSARTKRAALDLLIGRLEARQVLVSKSAQHFMPQEMPPHAKFSGMTVKDKKVPFIFLATGNEGDNLEPDGRKLFTLTLLTVLLARNIFAPVNYDGHTLDASSPREYELTAEILMPEAELGLRTFGGLNDVRVAADTYQVTPSALAMRAWRLGRLDNSTFERYMDELRTEYRNRAKEPKRNPLPVNALRNYNGMECSLRMLAILDSGGLSRADFRRIVLLNKAEISAFRQAIQ